MAIFHIWSYTIDFYIWSYIKLFRSGPAATLSHSMVLPRLCNIPGFCRDSVTYQGLATPIWDTSLSIGISDLLYQYFRSYPKTSRYQVICIFVYPHAHHTAMSENGSAELMVGNRMYLNIAHILSFAYVDQMRHGRWYECKRSANKHFSFGTCSHVIFKGWIFRNWIDS